MTSMMVDIRIGLLGGGPLVAWEACRCKLAAGACKGAGQTLGLQKILYRDPFYLRLDLLESFGYLPS